ncbi:MAG: CopD family protein [Pseudomonadota bacterium]
MIVSKFLHVLAAVIWIGGMFFAYLALRPAAAEVLEPPARLRLWAATFRRFFPWVWAAVIVILGSGFHMLGLLGATRVYVIAMLLLGVVMSIIYVYVYVGPFAALKRGCDAQDWKAAGSALARIRVLVGVNLTLGLLTIAVATLGRVLG